MSVVGKLTRNIRAKARIEQGEGREAMVKVHIFMEEDGGSDPPLILDLDIADAIALENEIHSAIQFLQELSVSVEWKDVERG